MTNRLRAIDWGLVSVPLLLIGLGIVVIYTITFPTVQFALAQAQLIAALLGVTGAVILTVLDYRSWQSLAPLFYVVGLLLLVAIFFIGLRQFGAVRWLELGTFQLQPSELMKLILILLLARLLTAWSGQLTLNRLVILLILAALPIALVVTQPDLGTASVLGLITIGLLIFARLPWRWWLGLALIAVLLLPAAYANLQDYQKARLRSFLNPQSDVSGQGYNVRQAQIAIGSGGILGQGLGRGSQSQLNFLPVAHTDFIFAGLAEATGLVGSSIVLGLYFVLINRAYRVASVAKDQFGMYVAAGIGLMFGFQVIVNIGMNLGLLPVTGIPLPFISFGGTSLIVSLAGIGLLQSIYARHKKITF